MGGGLNVWFCVCRGGRLSGLRPCPVDVLGRGRYRGEALKMKERYFIRNSKNKWEFIEVPETEAMRQADVVLWEEEEPGEWWAVYREDLIF